jgi:hypothetical protein
MRERRVGVEIEFAGIDTPAVAELVRDWTGGELRSLTEHEHEIETLEGTYKVELDSVPVKKIARAEGPIVEAAAELVGKVAQQIVPCEIVTPPLPESALPRLDELVQRLADAGGRGTFDALRFAFGLHFNPELLDPSAPQILAHLQAFGLLYPWLLEASEVDVTRRITVYVDPFPSAYVDHILRDDYAPDVGTLIDDYLAYNPTRNRALDCLPLFAHLDPARVRACLDDPRIKPRPAFHYRLPNSRVGEPGWVITDEWARWKRVERLANDADALARARRAHHEGRELRPELSVGHA